MTAPVPAPPPSGPPTPPAPRWLPDLDVEFPGDGAAPYERRGPDIVRIFPAQAGWTHTRIGVRRGDRHLEVRLDAAGLRALAADAAAKADLLDGGQR